MPFTREDVIAETRAWLGTPRHYQAAGKGVGCDCIGFVRGVAESFLGQIPTALDYSILRKVDWQRLFGIFKRADPTYR